MADEETPEVAKDESPEEAPQPTKAEEKKEEADDGVSPKSSGTKLDNDEFEKIVTETIDILKFIKDRVDELKIDCQKLSFGMLRVNETIGTYCRNYSPYLNTYLIRGEEITAGYYQEMCNFLPAYGDHKKAIELTQGDTVNIGIGVTKKTPLLNLVTNVHNNYYASTMFTRTLRQILMDVNQFMPERMGIVNKIAVPQPCWVQIQDRMNNQIEDVAKQAQTIQTYVEFMKQGIPKDGPQLDLSALTGDAGGSKAETK